MKDIIWNLYARGGYTFVDADGVKHEGRDWDDLFSKIEAYRKRAGKPIGDIQAEVVAEYCERQPGMCRDVGPSDVRGIRLDAKKNAVLAWLALAASIANELGKFPAGFRRTRP